MIFGIKYYKKLLVYIKLSLKIYLGYILRERCMQNFSMSVSFLSASILLAAAAIFPSSSYSSSTHSLVTNKHYVINERDQFEEEFKLAWIAGPENEGNFQVSPIFINSKLFVFYPDRGLKGFSPSSGDVHCEFSYPLSRSFRGVGVRGDLLIIPSAGEVLFFDTRTCSLSENFGVDGKLELSSFSLLEPAIDFKREIIISPALSGTVDLYDFNGEFLGDIDLNGELVQPRIWSGFSYDSELVLLKK